MIVIDGYSLEHYPRENKIIISLPQTMKKADYTFVPVRDRKETISELEKEMILLFVKVMFENNVAGVEE